VTTNTARPHYSQASDNPRILRHQAEAEANHLPALLARAQHLAGAVVLGDHGRRRAGVGDDFWQYRPAQTGDSRRMIDYRRSARGDIQIAREREWQIAQSVMLWVDSGASMRVSSDGATIPQKADRAQVVALALSILLIRGGERVGLTGSLLPPRRDKSQIHRLAQSILAQSLDKENTADYAPPEHRLMIPHAQAVFFSDFLGPLDEVITALTKAADRGVRGVLMMILDPQEEDFPWRGRTVFQSVGASLHHETLKASDLRASYLERLAARKDALQKLCLRTQWQFGVHHTNSSAQSALLWLYHALEARK
jgi:uncharacterized protein (DUF58 family)